MAITTFIDEHVSPIHPSRIFKASIVDSHNLIPKLMPQAIKSVDILEGSGGAGSIKQINFAQGGNFKFVKYRVDELNEESLVYRYTLIEGDALIEKLEKITYEVKLEQTEDGGSVSKVTSKYYTVGDFVLKEDEVKAGKERVLGMYKAVEAFLLQNPDAYAY
ncbi:major allergen Pru ar 1-like [Primulina huaijiensis]|uniref:major allergen Pru ar 1-like n=1 Tax=Primulina huaijiensis TaxID=1492673 RepID=UPI003CC78772